MPSVQIPEKLSFFFQPKRYKVAYGGRGSAKSWTAATALISRAVSSRVRILCCREIQQSIKESSHKLISNQIARLGLSADFRINDNSILNKKTGAEFIFYGLFRNVDQIKSLEAVDIAWVEEAHKVSKESWDYLIPTIRQDGSEIWVTFNPEYEDDETYARFVTTPPEDCYSVEVNYYDNPFFPEVLRKEMEQDKARDFQKYEQVWLGKPKGSGRRVWSGYSEDVHLRHVPIEFIAEHGVCFTAMDPHSKYYPFIVCIAALPKNTRKRWPEDYYRHVYAEWPSKELLGGFYHELRKTLLFPGTLADLSRDIQITEGVSFGIKPRARVMDTRFAKGAGGNNWSTSTEGIVKQLAKPENGGLIWQLPKEKSIDVQRDKIHADMLWNRQIPRGEFNEPSFSVDPACLNVRASLKNHRLEEGEEKESEKFKDPSDALRIGWASMMEKRVQNPAAQNTQVATINIGTGFWGNG